MKQVIIKDIDNDKEVLRYNTSKRSTSTIETELLENIQKHYNHRPFMQGTYSFYNRAGNRFTIGGNLWWVVGGCEGRLQYQVVE